MPDLSGRVAVVSGANTGVGFESARVLVAHGAHVVLACRNLGKAGRAVSALLAVRSGGEVTAVEVDLSSLASVRGAAEEIRQRHEGIDLLVNNAGVMDLPYARSADGHELTWATNHLGHFALTGLLLDRLVQREGSRVVTVSSIAHRRATPDYVRPTSREEYDASAAYAQSKLANLMFTFEWDRRLRGSGIPTCALAAHPGVVDTELWRTSSVAERILVSRRLRWLNFRIAQQPAMGALPVLRAATDPEAKGSQYYGPNGWREATGHPVVVEATPLARDAIAQRRLWDESERLTEVRFPLPPAPER